MKNIQEIPKKIGGARPGAGRPAGSLNKISAKSILDSIEKETGHDFVDLLAQGYHKSILEDDKNTRLQYEKMFLSKVVADKVDITSEGERISAPIINIMSKEIPDFINVKSS